MQQTTTTTTTVFHTLFLFVIFVSLGTTLFPIEAKDIKCDTNSSETEVDELVAQIMVVGLPNKKFAETKAEMRQFCKKQVNLLTKMENYKNQCMKDQSKQVASVAIFSIKSLFKSYCRNLNSKRASAFIAGSTCANKVLDEYNKCYLSYIDRLTSALELKNGKSQIAHVCCGYYQIQSCMRDRAADTPGCDSNKIETNVHYIRGFFDSAIDVLCTDYTEQSDKCDHVKVLKRKVDPKKRPKSFFNPIIKIMSNL